MYIYVYIDKTHIYIYIYEYLQSQTNIYTYIIVGYCWCWTNKWRQPNAPTRAITTSNNTEELAKSRDLPPKPNTLRSSQ